jgi:hypothetical protein
MKAPDWAPGDKIICIDKRPGGWVNMGRNMEPMSGPALGEECTVIRVSLYFQIPIVFMVEYAMPYDARFFEKKPPPKETSIEVFEEILHKCKQPETA